MPPPSFRNRHRRKPSGPWGALFPYQLDITGAPGVAEGTLYLSEQQSDGSYQELGHYPLTFEKVE